MTFPSIHDAQVNPDKRARTTFWDPRFLALAAILGAGCSATYYATGGSLVAAAATHWVPVNLWLFLLGARAPSLCGAGRRLSR